MTDTLRPAPNGNSLPVLAVAGLLHRASHDALTGLLTRSVFMARVADAITRAEAASGRSAVLYLDLDFFKEINDTYGHQLGDQVLSAASRRITAALRPTDTVARLGGDELGVLTPHLESEQEATQLAERIVKTIRRPFTVGEQVLHLSVSIGVAFSTDGGSTAIDLVEQADQAMYRAKACGRAGWATSTIGSNAADTGTPVDVGDVTLGVANARARLIDLLADVDLRDVTYTRLAQASQALGRVEALLDGTGRIG